MTIIDWLLLCSFTLVASCIVGMGIFICPLLRTIYRLTLEIKEISTRNLIMVEAAAGGNMPITHKLAGIATNPPVSPPSLIPQSLISPTPTKPLDNFTGLRIKQQL